MTAQIHGSKTEINMLKTFAGESQARNRYSYFADKARQEGYDQIAAVFEETAGQEKIHAWRFFRLLEGYPLEITGTYPAGKIGNTMHNLQEAAAGEYEEWHDLYPSFARTAKEEGFYEIAQLWENICVSERQHEHRYRALLKNIELDRVFKREEKVRWRCRKCGFVHEGTEAPQNCPACGYGRGFFELLTENW